MNRSTMGCGTTPVEASGNCGAFTVTATGGPITLGTPWFTSSNPAFSAGGQCYSGQQLASGKSCLAQGLFHPTVAGSNTGTLTIHSADGLSKSISISGTAPATGAYMTISPSTRNCGAAAVGEAKDCGTFTITAVGGSVTLATFLSSSIFTTNFVLDRGACKKGMVLNEGDSCETGTLTFQPTQTGVRSDMLALSNQGGQYLLVQVTGSASTTSWQALGWGSCEGGSGTWQEGVWAPALGCGLVEQNRTVTCAIDSNSGTQTQTIQCIDGEGNVVPNSQCDEASKPLESMSCTPTNEAVCGTRPDSTQITMLNNDCPVGCTPDPENHKYCVLMPL